MHTNIFRISTVLILIALISTVIGQAPVATATPSETTTTGITLTATTTGGDPLAGADVLVMPLKLRGQTDAAGTVTFENLTVPEKIDVTVTVEAQGYRSWMIRNAVVYPNDTLILDAPLSVADGAETTPEVIDVPVHRTESAEPQTIADELDEMAPLVAGSNTTPPTHIHVYRVKLGRVDTVEFKQYVKHVLPNEWIASWPRESLRSGAMASKTYAWYRTMYAKYPGKGYDTKDTTADQVYNPNVSYLSTNLAVDDTWGYRFTRNKAIFQTQYCAGTYNNSRTSGQCGEKHGFTDGNFMSQNGSHYWANQGKNWQWILNFYYANITISRIGSDPGPGPSPTWPNYRRGDSGTNVFTIQLLLQVHGHSLGVDGNFGPETDRTVRDFQSQQGLKVDGVVGSQTWQALIINVKEGDQGVAVQAAQRQLNKYGYNLEVDGKFGPKTDTATRDFQLKHNLTVDGKIGPQTWPTLVSGP
ncbi:MAG: Peptidoglycan hydrolase (amidase) enhancer domain [Chloroflexi bacterium AL-W]|nr:Peptidoglycan hydrolase (amidase) enhancer domain [Chloroflexi bacterium AL-N1]NOK69748.1 Peptidoglycan hydrolase (amidase) enhancer domain [Chloroflexi bacterium AL-N10]NOK73648.1 Peptidoglycan hydrolase (amidase) enhancer domain [Chloroflexi bacterium AL-N5]NOK83918.1 Peptidoglycan hydrolase (amidase) enhancer domain [Chloroflexi bacterium AL-W]NOK87979.1 Peptidoglycan hydrolase (amidase) enhancer domain [Chloroflexi bacterium AL-N15]